MTKCCNDPNCAHDRGQIETKSETIFRGTTTRREFLNMLGAGTAAAATVAMAPSAFASNAAKIDADGMIDSIGFGARAKDKPLERIAFKRYAPRDNEVLVDIMYCGLCHSDIHSVRDNLNIPFRTPFPSIAGHEIIGRISHVGKNAKLHKVGDIVGVGPYINSDGSMPGLDQYANATLTYGGQDPRGGIVQGGFSTNIVVDERHALKIPTGANLAATAPLLCAGITTYTPLKNAQIKEGSKVAVVGLGGLGHMALKRAKDLGAHVTVFTTTKDKIPDAKRMGADEAMLWPAHMGEYFAKAGQFDIVLTTVPYDFDMDGFMIMLKIGGILTNVGLLEKGSQSHLFVNMRQININGSLTGSLADMQKVINDGHANKNLLPEIELIGIDKLNQAIDNVYNKKARYRYVVDMSTLS